MRLLISFLLAFCLSNQSMLLNAAPLPSGGRIESRDGADFIQVIASRDGRLRFEYCQKGSRLCQTIGRTAGYTSAELEQIAHRLEIKRNASWAAITLIGVAAGVGMYFTGVMSAFGPALLSEGGLFGVYRVIKVSTLIVGDGIVGTMLFPAAFYALLANLTTHGLAYVLQFSPFEYSRKMKAVRLSLGSLGKNTTADQAIVNLKNSLQGALR